MHYSNIIVTTDGPIARVTVNRPDKLNALNRATMTELARAFDDISSKPEHRVVVLTGAGQKAFVAGADISEINSLSPVDALQFSLLGQQLMLMGEELGKPVIAAVNGYALGGGCELAMACTLRVAADNARFGLPEVSLGLLPGFGGSQRLSRLVGKGKAMEMTLTGQQVNAQQALALGLANQVVATDQLAPTIEQLAGKLASSAPIAMQHIIAAINHGNETSLERGLEYESQLFALCCATKDMREGTSAFLNKRDAEFSGS